jgi:isopentenyl diphosphate isomerase/L-lactate dehydrogenase-like FMN-dependent dehydrogenase
MSAGCNRRQALARFSSLLAASPLLRAQQAPQLIGEPPGRIAPRGELVNVLEFAPMAERKLDNPTYATIAGGDRQPFERMTFRQRLMVNTVDLDLSTELFGTTLFAPIVVGPASNQKRFHPNGELATARGAVAGKGLMVVAGRSSFPIEEIAAQLQGPFWHQIHPEPDAAAVVKRAQQAVQAGCKAILITVGTPYEANRTARGLSQLPVLGNPAIDWDYLDRLRQKISVPILLKGIMSAEEAHAAVEKGIAGIVVSNHGDRFLTGLAHPITALPAIADAVGQKIPILIDGSFRRGSDVLKALALGARAVLIARPPLWGLAAYGADGVQTVLELLQTELAADMAMIGAVNPQAIVRDMVKIHRR